MCQDSLATIWYYYTINIIVHINMLKTYNSLSLGLVLLQTKFFAIYVRQQRENGLANYLLPCQ